jgi:hypothetical protein
MSRCALRRGIRIERFACYTSPRARGVHLEVEMWLVAVSVARCADEVDQMVRRSDGRQWSGEPIVLYEPGGRDNAGRTLPT